MSTLDNLFADHQLIKRVTDAFEVYLSKLPAEKSEHQQDLHRFVTFFREYADLSHHEKEETILMPAMVEAGADWDSEPLAKIRQDHQQERYLMRVLRQAAALRTLWNDEDVRHLKSVGQELVDYLRQHMSKENTLIYPLAKQLLVGEKGSKFERDLEDFEKLRVTHGYTGWLRELADELIQEYGPEQS